MMKKQTKTNRKKNSGTFRCRGKTAMGQGTFSFQRKNACMVSQHEGLQLPSVHQTRSPSRSDPSHVTPLCNLFTSLCPNAAAQNIFTFAASRRPPHMAAGVSTATGTQEAERHNNMSDQREERSATFVSRGAANQLYCPGVGSSDLRVNTHTHTIYI